MYKDSWNLRRTLAPHTCLKHRYVIHEVLGEGGFGVTYGGRDKETGKHVAIKEYFPSGLAVRTEQVGAFFLCPLSAKGEELFQHGRERFLNEAKILKEFQNLESIVSVYDVFEENNTAYIVMEYIEGLTLRRYIEENGCLCFTELLELMTPVMRALSAVHKKKLIHRDISPDNLLLGTDNRLHVIDFGAAGHEDITGGQQTVILKAGYAPPEQYISGSKTGAWIDVYALCATMYFALAGKPPSEAIHRLEQDSLDFPDTIKDLLPWQRAVLEKGLHIRMSSRFCNMEELYDAITSPPDTEKQVTVAGGSLTKREKQKIRQMRYRLKLPLLFSMLLFLAGGAVLAGLAVRQRWLAVQSPASVTASPQQVSSPPQEDVPRSVAPGQSGNSSQEAVSGQPGSQTQETASAQASGSAQASSPSNEISAAVVPLSMPGLSGKKVKQAKKVLKKLDAAIQVETTRVYDNTVKKGRVVSQSVVEGTLFSKGRLPSVLLTVSRGKKPSKALPRQTETPQSQKADSGTKAAITPKATPKAKTAPKHTATPQPKKTQKKPSGEYHLTPDDDGFVTVPLD